MNLHFSACFLDKLDDFNTWSWNLVSWSIKNIIDLPNYKLSAFCQKISQLNIIVTYVPNKWITYVLKISPFSNPWKTITNKRAYERSHKSLNSYSLVEYNKIYPNTNSWKTLQEESLWQEDFDNLYFWNTLNKTH